MKGSSLIVAALAALLVVGCTGAAKDPEPTGAPTSNSTSEFKVALLTPGTVSDSGWSAMAYDGLKAIADEMGAEINNQEAKETQINDAMRSYAQKGYHLVFGHGYEYNRPAIEVAKDFPNTVFVSSSGGATAKNVGAFRFYLEQGFYLAGFTAGLSTKTGKVAMIGGDDVPSIRSTFKAFKAGAESARPDLKVIEIFTGSGQDIARAKQATLGAIAEGADFVIHQANAAAQGVFDACKEKGVLAFGANLDQNDNPSGAVIASAIIIAKPAFLTLAKAVKDGSYNGSIVLMGMEHGTIDYVVNPALKDKLTPAVLASIEETRARILSGALTVPKDEF